ncbi:hypothetical protein [Streptomyces sp. WAC08241]|uniref:hypothetical protein n=1 Tax=Streptomyces sp. WAC08241 TaxID=2487421 RepID=UPI000F7A0756|nr:hypothetical protein [Streptomyces sp. WAC08241]RSS47099.1 hypothetical protein EF906_00165 [Streptomyces sp. WAC08241]
MHMKRTLHERTSDPHGPLRRFGSNSDIGETAAEEDGTAEKRSTPERTATPGALSTTVRRYRGP